MLFLAAKQRGREEERGNCSSSSISDLFHFIKPAWRTVFRRGIPLTNRVFMVKIQLNYGVFTFFSFFSCIFLWNGIWRFIISIFSKPLQRIPPVAPRPLAAGEETCAREVEENGTCTRHSHPWCNYFYTKHPAFHLRSVCFSSSFLLLKLQMTTRLL